MASKTCVSCLRTLQRQPRSIAQTGLNQQSGKQLRTAPARGTISRAFTTTTARNAELPDALKVTPSTSIPPVTPKRAPGGQQPVAKLEKLTQSLKGSVTATYTAYGSTEVLYKECASQADYTMPKASDEGAEVPKTEDGIDLGIGKTWWHTELGLQPTFSTWSQVTMLHMYLLTARFRAFHGDPTIWQHHLLDHFSYDAENKMTTLHNMEARGTRNKYLKDVYVQWRGLLAAYDEGLFKGDAVLAAAVWRNVFKANEDVNLKGLAMVVSYMRRTLKGLDALPDDKIRLADVGFGSPKLEEALVKTRSPMFDLPFEKAQGKPIPTKKIN